MSFSLSRPRSPILKNGRRNFTRSSESWQTRRLSSRSSPATLFRRRTHASETFRRARCFLTRCGMRRSFSSNNKQSFSHKATKLKTSRSYSRALSHKFGKQALGFLGWLDAEFGVQFFLHAFEVLLNGRGLGLRGESSHRQPVHVLAKGIACQGFARVLQSVGPAAFGKGQFCESGNNTCGLL